MWKLIVITTGLMLFGLVNAYASDFRYGDKAKQDKIQTVINSERKMSFSDFITGLDISDNMNTGLIFGLDSSRTPAHDGPDAPPETFGLGLGLSFSF